MDAFAAAALKLLLMDLAHKVEGASQAPFDSVLVAWSRQEVTNTARDVTHVTFSIQINDTM